MKESRYRESCVCRALGNPVVYSIVRLLHERGPMSPTKIAEIVCRRLQTVSGHLATLRAADLVRYERRDGATRYWLKHESETGRLLAALVALVKQLGIGRSLAAPPSHTTVRTGPYTAVRHG